MCPMRDVNLEKIILRWIIAVFAASATILLLQAATRAEMPTISRRLDALERYKRAQDDLNRAQIAWDEDHDARPTYRR